jgi:hypothetical protein
MRRGIRPARFGVMRRFAGLLFGTAVGLSALAAGAQQVTTVATLPKPPAAPPQPSAVARDGARDGRPVAPLPLVEPLYDPSKHAGLTEAAWLRATRGTGRRSTGMMVAGIILDGVGALLMLTGTVVYVNGNDQPCGAGGQSPVVLPCSSTTNHVTGMALLASGVIGLGLGLPLTFYGAADVPRAEAGGLGGPRFPRATVALGLRGAALALHF